MLFSRFIKDRGAAINAVDKLATGVLCLIVLNGLLLWKSFGNHERFVFLPAKLDTRATLAYDAASKSLHEKYGLSFSVLIGNMTPASANNVIDSLKLMFTPQLYKQMHSQLLVQAKQIKEAGVTLSFTPDRIEYEPATRKTFVTGTQRSATHQGEPKEKTVTYEYKLLISEYIPYISHFNFYTGPSRNQLWLSKNQHKLNLIKQAEQEKENASK
jgi:conjugal transfer pilus assembly protein TraE